MRPKTKDETLYYKLRTRATLRRSWQTIVENGGRSPRQKTRDAVKLFDSRIENELDVIYTRLHRGNYAFSPARGVLLKSSHKKTPRPIVVSQYRDRIVQRSLNCTVLDVPNVKKIVQTTYSFGGVPDGGVGKAIERAMLSITNGYQYFIKTDIKEYYVNVPRLKALNILFDQLPDVSLNSILKEATKVELENIGSLPQKEIDLFPLDEDGVAQGNCLSPLLGNILLASFDQNMNENDIVCLRYIDDILILGRTKKSTQDAFKKAKRLLASHNLKVYNPHDRSGKSSEGPTTKQFDYLGCSVSPTTVSPNREARGRLLHKLHQFISNCHTGSNPNSSEPTQMYMCSLTETLRLFHIVIRAWGAHYSFCNSQQVFNKMDEQIDQILVEFLGWYNSKRLKLSKTEKRRLLGVQMLVDCKSNPILKSKNLRPLPPTSPDIS